MACRVLPQVKEAWAQAAARQGRSLSEHVAAKLSEAVGVRVDP